MCMNTLGETVFLLFAFSHLTVRLTFKLSVPTSNGGYRREEKSHKHRSLFTMLLSSVTANFYLSKKSKQLYALNTLEIREQGQQILLNKH